MPAARAWDRWTAFLLSLGLPGAGQVWAGSGTCVVWLTAAALAAWVHPVLLVAVALASARHAQLCFGGRAVARDAVRLSYVDGRVDMTATVPTDLSRELTWAFVSDLERFGTVDPLHDEVRRDGRDLVLDHCVLGYRFTRVGRILHWHEGKRYAFSDLSLRGPRHGFPHVFFISVETPGAITIRVRGRWTARWLPAFLVRAWLRFVAREHARLLRGVLCTA